MTKGKFGGQGTAGVITCFCTTGGNAVTAATAAAAATAFAAAAAAPLPQPRSLAHAGGGCAIACGASCCATCPRVGHNPALLCIF
jgi:hypothetical protein